MKKIKKIGTTLRLPPYDLKRARRISYHLGMNLSDYCRFAIHTSNEAYDKKLKGKKCSL